MIIFHIFSVINGAVRDSGLRSRTAWFGGSVARASAAKVSMIRLTQSNCTGVRIDSSFGLAIADIKVKVTAVILTVS